MRPKLRQLTPAQAYQAAVSLHRQGRLDVAERTYETVLRLAPEHSGALRHLGSLMTQRGRYAEAVKLIEKSLVFDPNSAGAHNDLGMALMGLRRVQDASAEFAKAVALMPDFAESICPIELTPQDMTRMLLNLFGNGFYAVSKRSRSGAVSDFSPTLKVTTRDLGEVVEIRVRDNGGDIPDNISHLSPNCWHFLRKILSDHSRNDGRRGESPRRCGSGTAGLRQIVPIGSGDPLDHADIQESTQLPG